MKLNRNPQHWARGNAREPNRPQQPIPATPKRKRAESHYYCSYCDARAGALRCERCGNTASPYPAMSEEAP